MFDDFMIRAFAAGVAVAFAAGPLGCFVVWRRMAYFGDATAHAAILGVALAFWFSLSVLAGVLLTSLAVALLAVWLGGRGHAMDTALGVLAHSALAFGVVAASFLSGVRLDLQGFLFGDILTLSDRDLWLIWSGALVVVALLVWRWQALLTATISDDLARVSGIDPRRERLILSVALAIVVAVSVKLIGALLISAMLIIPAATARAGARSPEGMASGAAGIGMLAVAGGLFAASRFDTPAGPTIVTTAAALFVLSLIGGYLRGEARGRLRLRG